MPTNEFQKGDRVAYIHGEQGTVNSINDTYVFVIFDLDTLYAKQEYGKACYPDMLTKIPTDDTSSEHTP